MGREISIDVNSVQTMANDFVKEMTYIENLSKNLRSQMNEVVSMAYYSPYFQNCITGLVSQNATTHQAENNLVSKISKTESYARKTADQFEEADSMLAKLLKFNELWGNFTAAGTTSLLTLAASRTGFPKFVKEGVKWGVQYQDDYMRAISKIENSRFKNYVRFWLNPLSLGKKYKDYHVGDFIAKKLTNFYPKVIVDYSNAAENIKKGYKSDGFKSAMKTAMKTDAESLLKTGAKFAKSNAISGVLVTAAGETVGLGMNVFDNYRKYGGNEAVLKRENAKAVGRAVNNTIVGGGVIAAGGVIGGTIGTFIGGPVGTVVGAAAGSFLAGFVSDKIASKTAGFAENMAVKFKEPIHSAIEVTGSTLKKAGDFVNKVEDSAKSLVNKGKNFFKKFAF
ncbi:hypothetical protein V7183_11705 [Bacillus sp. JJ1127]|uniref:hypothetical protein n=1 Tax=Bacillus sp. JJ1127 TaxID=3122952 RepID=UPI003000B94C